MAQVRKHMLADGTTSYEWLRYTPAEMAAVTAEKDQPAWIEAHATIIETVTQAGLIAPPHANAPNKAGAAA